MKKISIAASLLLLSSSVLLADSSTVKEAFTNGKTSGALDIYYTTTDGKSTVTDTGFTSGAVTLSYETDSYKGFSGKVTFVGATEISEENNGDYKGSVAKNSILAESSITYAQDDFSITAGRQEIDLEWLGDYNEAVVIATTVIPDTTLVLGYTDKKATIGVDEISSEFADVNGNNGAYVIDAKYTGIEGIELNPYYYKAEDVANFYGLKISYENDLFGAVAQYAVSSEKAAATEDGSIFNAELSTTVSGVSLAGGYIKTDKKGGIGSISAFGDNVSPFEDGNYAYAGASTSVNEKTYYASIAYTIADVELSALYGKTKYDTTTTSGDSEKELNLAAAYSFSDELSASLLYVDVSANSSVDDYDKVIATLTYSF